METRAAKISLAVALFALLFSVTAAQAQRARGEVRITVRDLSDSREHWKAVARRQSGQIAALRAQLDQAHEAPKAGGS